MTQEAVTQTIDTLRLAVWIERMAFWEPVTISQEAVQKAVTEAKEEWEVVD